MGQICRPDLRSKKLTGDGSYEELSTVMIYSMGLTIGLTVTDIDNMTAGEIFDLVYYRANQNEEHRSKPETERKATQADYDSF